MQVPFRFRFVATAVVVFLTPTGAAPAADLDARTKLFAAMDRYTKQWDQGFIEAQVESAAGPADVTLWWDNTDWRLDYVTYRADGEGVDPTWTIFVVGGDQFCRYYPLDDSLSVASRNVLPDVRRRVQLRVQPIESWFELSRERSLKKWLDQPTANQKSIVLERPEGGFDAFIGRDEQLTTCQRAAASGPVSDLSIDDGFVFHLTFNALGLMTGVKTIGQPPRGSGIEIQCEWTSDPLPMPRRLIRRFQSAQSDDYYTHLEIVVLRVGNQLPPDTPSFDVPPGDLPLRTGP